jgi:cytochrome c oxidase cbb3-type subunit 3
MFRRLVNVVEVLALIGAALAVILLFANEPDSGTAAPSAPGADVFAANCAGCHGADGGGGTGPQLSDGEAVAQFPNIDDEIEVVSDGRGSMPAFGGRLSATELRDVVEYTRTL